ncbi:unnamed protein product [Lota lota]
MDGYARAEDEPFSSRLVSLTWEDSFEQILSGPGLCRIQWALEPCQQFNERLVVVPEHIAKIWMANYLIKNFAKVQPHTYR